MIHEHIKIETGISTKFIYPLRAFIDDSCGIENKNLRKRYLRFSHDSGEIPSLAAYEVQIDIDTDVEKGRVDTWSGCYCGDIIIHISVLDAEYKESLFYFPDYK
jgi:hypothetical protein